MTWHQSMVHKGPVKRLRYIGTERARTQLLLCSRLSNIYIKDGEMPRLSAFIGSLHSIFCLWPLLQKAYIPTVLNEVYLVILSMAELQ